MKLTEQEKSQVILKIAKAIKAKKIKQFDLEGKIKLTNDGKTPEEKR